WNGLAIGALSDAGAMLGRPELVAAAERAATLLSRLHLVGSGRLLRVSRDGLGGRHAGVAEDHGDVAEGLLALYAATGDPGHLRRAGQLLDAALDHFADGHGGFFDTADDAEALVTRPRDPTDNATPAGASALAAALLTY